MDFGDLAKLLQDIHASLDHQLLNDVRGLENPTSEQIAFWIAERLEPQLSPSISLERVRVRETCQSAASYRPSR